MFESQKSYEITDLGGAIYHALAKNGLESISTIDSTSRSDEHADPILALLASEDDNHKASLYFKDKRGIPKVEVTHNPKKNLTTIDGPGLKMPFGIAKELVGICKKSIPNYNLMRGFYKTSGFQRDESFYHFDAETYPHPQIHSTPQLPLSLAEVQHSPHASVYSDGESIEELCAVTQ